MVAHRLGQLEQPPTYRVRRLEGPFVIETSVEPEQRESASGSPAHDVGDFVPVGALRPRHPAARWDGCGHHVFRRSDREVAVAPVARSPMELLEHEGQTHRAHVETGPDARDAGFVEIGREVRRPQPRSVEVPLVARRVEELEREGEHARRVRVQRGAERLRL